MTGAQWIESLNLVPHPEGGYYRETYRATERVEANGLPARFQASRSLSTAIYYLLERGDFSSFHRIKSDEIWHHYAGGDLCLHLLDPATGHVALRLGCNPDTGAQPQMVVPQGTWFAAEVSAESDYTLAGCTLAPGFEFADLEMATAAVLSTEYPDAADLVRRLTRG